MDQENTQIQTPTWKKALALIGAALFLLGLGYAIGRYEAPTKTVVTEKVVTVERQVVVTQTQTEVKVVYVKVKDQHTHETTTTTKQPNGTTTTTTTKDSDTHTSTSNNSDTKTDTQTKSETDKQTQKETKTVVQYERPQWSIGVLGGLYAPHPLDGPPRNLLPYNQLVLGAEVDRRLLGPISAGVWGLSSGEAGIKLRIDF